MIQKVKERSTRYVPSASVVARIQFRHLAVLRWNSPFLPDKSKLVTAVVAAAAIGKLLLVVVEDMEVNKLVVEWKKRDNRIMIFMEELSIASYLLWRKSGATFYSMPVCTKLLFREGDFYFSRFDDRWTSRIIFLLRS
jgi:hypothetical protein